MPEAIPDLVRCPHCGAGNPAGADWCGQCLRRFDAPVSGNGHRPAPSGGPSAPATIRPGGGPAIRARDDAEPLWICPACETENELTASNCSRCGSAFTSFFADTAAASAPRVSRGAAIASSVALPGAGHLMIRQTGPGIARALLYLWSVGIALLLLVWPPHGAQTIVRGVGALFALSAVAIWALSMLETMRFLEGDQRLLVPPKTLTWFTAGMTALLFAGLLSAAFIGR